VAQRLVSDFFGSLPHEVGRTVILRLIRRRSEKKRRAQQLYGSIVAQARREEFYRFWKVPDTVNGRFDMIVLHLFLLIQRLQLEGEEGLDAGRLLAETFFSDMDNSVREQGAGDLAVAKYVRRMADAFYGRLSSYRKAVEDGGNDVLANALKRNIFPDHAQGGCGAEQRTAEAIAAYMREAEKDLGKVPFARILAGRIDFPEISANAPLPDKQRQR